MPALQAWFAKFYDGIYASLIIDERWRLFLSGIKNTLLLTGFACLIGLAIGVAVAVIKYYSHERRSDGQKGGLLGAADFLCNLYTTVIRGTPVVIQLLILFTVAFSEGFQACIVGFGINSGAYVSEIIRSGLMSVDRGQTEAGRSLGLSRGATMRLIILPQAIKNILPALFNEIIALLKETSVAGYIAVRDLTKVSEGIKARTFRPEALFVAAAIYLVLVIILSAFQKSMEKYFARSE